AYRLAEGEEALFGIHLRLDRRGLVDEMVFIERVQRSGPAVAGAADMIERHIARGAQQEGAGIMDGAASLGLEAAHKGLLQHVLDIMPVHDSTYRAGKHAPAGQVHRFDATVWALVHGLSRAPQDPYARHYRRFPRRGSTELLKNL